MKTRSTIPNPNISPFLGIGVGKKKEREARAAAQLEKAKADAAIRIEEARRQTTLLNLEAARQGFNPEAAAQQSAIKIEETKQGSEKTLYMVVGFVVVVVMAGLYFIKK